jgi:hypothetical protein
MSVMYFSACNMEEHEGIDLAGGGSRCAVLVKVWKNSIFMLKLLLRKYDGLKFMYFA